MIFSFDIYVFNLMIIKGNFGKVIFRVSKNRHMKVVLAESGQIGSNGLTLND